MEMVETEAGRLAGIDGEVSVFKGIPFAAPPIVALRWRPPAPVKSWHGVRSAIEFGDELRVGNSWRAAQMDFLDAYFDTK
jgi:para-nitrobenzyl esterase